MPPIEKHMKTSIDKTGNDFRKVHEWLDGDPAVKVARHDITKIHEYGTMIKEKYGEEGFEEYIQHLKDDVKAKFNHLQRELDKQIADTLAYFGVK